MVDAQLSGKRTGAPNRVPFSVLPVFFAGGAASLIYQVGWQRALGTLLGSGSESATIIVAVFMAGLGAGSAAGGFISARSGDPLKWFAGFEAFTGAYGAVSLFVMRSAAESVLPTAGIAALLSALFLLPPTLCMGASLPLLVQYLKKKSPDAADGRIVSLLYFINTAGAAAASAATVLVLFGALGLQKSLWCASVLNAVAAAAALIIRCGDLK